jgi:heat shock protein HtpX
MNLASYKAGNAFKTFVLVAALTGLLLAIGYLVGGASGLIVFAAIAVVFNFVMYWFSGPIALKMSRAVEVGPQQEPELHAMIARLAERAGVPKPGVYVTPAEQPNAFATGRNPNHAAIAVTAGIRRALGPRELEGVLAHEMAHIANRDILIASIAAMVAGAIAAIANFLQFSLLFGGDDENPLGLIGTLAAIIVAPIAATIIQLAISRQREFVADATGAEYLGDPNPLADALESLDRTARAIPMRVNPAAEPLYIVNPLQAHARGRGGAGGFARLFSTHPPMEERVARLRRMAGAGSLQLQTF